MNFRDEKINRAIETFSSVMKTKPFTMVSEDIFRLGDPMTPLYAHISFIERDIKSVDVMPVSVKKLSETYEKRANQYIVWICWDGVIFDKIDNLTGTIKSKDKNLQAFYTKASTTKYIRFR